MIDLMERMKNIKKWGPGSDIKKGLIEVCILDKQTNKELQYSFVSRDNDGLTYDYIRNGIISTILQVPPIEKDKIAYLKRVDLFKFIPNVAYVKSKNRKHFDMVIDVNNLLD